MRAPALLTSPSPRVALGAVALAATLWAIAAAVASELFDAGVTPLELTAARALIAAVGLGLAGGARRNGEARLAGRGDHAGLAPAKLIAFGLSIALVNATYYTAIDRVPVAVAIVLQYCSPVLVVLWAAASRRRRPSADVALALLASAVGVVLVSGLAGAGFGDADGLGIAMGLASAVFFSAYTLLAEQAGPAYGATGAMFRAFTIASIFWILYQLPNGWPESLFSAGNLAGVAFVGVAGTLLPFLFFIWGVGHLRAERAAIAATLEPVVAAVVAWIWLGQRLSALQLAGGSLVIGAVLTLQLRRASVDES